MPKDAKGHGSNPRGTLQKLGIPVGGDYHTLHSSKVQDLVDEAKRAGYRKPANANGSTGRYFHDYLQRGAARQSADDSMAAGTLSTGAKSAPAPEHDSFEGYAPGGRHGYNPSAVNEAIAAQNRSGRGKIGGREARTIHALLKGRG